MDLNIRKLVAHGPFGASSLVCVVFSCPSTLEPASNGCCGLVVSEEDGSVAGVFPCRRHSRLLESACPS